MRVVHFPSWYFPSGSNSLAGRMILHLTAAQQKQKIDATIFYPEFNPRGPLFTKKITEVVDDVSAYRTRGWFPPKMNEWVFSRWADRSASAFHSFMDRFGKPEIIHAHSYPAAYACARVQSKFGIPYIYTERLSDVLTNNLPTWRKKVIIKGLEKASAVTAVSPGMAERLSTWTAKPISVIPNFYDSEIFYLDPSAVKSDQFTWVSVGEPAHTKGLDVLLEAFSRLPEKIGHKSMRLILADDIPQQTELEQLARALKIETRVSFVGLLSQKELADLYHKSHVLVSASRVETFGKTMIEAQATGLPIVTTNSAGGRFILQHEFQGEMAQAGQSVDLTRAMAQVYLGYVQYDPQKIHSHIEQHFSQAVVIPRWIELYQNVCS